MAEEGIVKGLFGLSPYEIQQQRLASTNTQAHNYATLDPFQKASQSMFQAGAGLGGVGMQMAGYVDPEQQKAEQKQAILSKYDISTQEGMAQAMQAAKAMGRNDVVLDLQQYDNSMQKEYYARKLTQSQIDQNSARAEKARRLGELKNTYPKEYNMALAEAKRLHPNDPQAESDAIAELMPKYLKNPNLQFKEYVNAKGEKTFGVVDLTLADAIQVGGSTPILKKRTIGVEGKPKLAQDQEYDAETSTWKNVGGEYERHGGGVNVKVENIVGSANKNAQFRKNVIETVKPQYEIVMNADMGIGALQDSLATGNFIGFNAARGSIAKAMGDTHISAADIKAAGGDPSLVGGFVDYLNKLGTGTPSKDTQQKMLATLQLLKKIASQKANTELDMQRKLGLMDGMSKEEIDASLDFPEFKPGTSKTPIQKVLKSGKTVTVEQD